MIAKVYPSSGADKDEPDDTTIGAANFFTSQEEEDEWAKLIHGGGVTANKARKVMDKEIKERRINFDALNLLMEEIFNEQQANVPKYFAKWYRGLSLDDQKQAAKSLRYYSKEIIDPSTAAHHAYRAITGENPPVGLKGGFFDWVRSLNVNERKTADDLLRSATEMGMDINDAKQAVYQQITGKGEPVTPEAAPEATAAAPAQAAKASVPKAFADWYRELPVNYQTKVKGLFTNLSQQNPPDVAAKKAYFELTRERLPREFKEPIDAEVSQWANAALASPEGDPITALTKLDGSLQAFAKGEIQVQQLKAAAFAAKGVIDYYSRMMRSGMQLLGKAVPGSVNEDIDPSLKKTVERWASIVGRGAKETAGGGVEGQTLGTTRFSSFPILIRKLKGGMHVLKQLANNPKLIKKAVDAIKQTSDVIGELSNSIANIDSVADQIISKHGGNASIEAGGENKPPLEKVDPAVQKAREQYGLAAPQAPPLPGREGGARQEEAQARTGDKKAQFKHFLDIVLEKTGVSYQQAVEAIKMIKDRNQKRTASGRQDGAQITAQDLKRAILGINPEADLLDTKVQSILGVIKMLFRVGALSGDVIKKAAATGKVGELKVSGGEATAAPAQGDISISGGEASKAGGDISISGGNVSAESLLIRARSHAGHHRMFVESFEFEYEPELLQEILATTRAIETILEIL
jgi:hypothetical protein